MRKNQHPHAEYMQCKPGQKDAGYKAGEIYGCYGHRTYAHQPCAFKLTEGEVQCQFCTAGMEAVFRAYVPLWDRDWALRYVLVGENVFESVDEIPHRAQVLVCRAKNPISPLVVREEKVLHRELPNRSPWSDEVDMLAVCLTLWKDAALTKWFKKRTPAPKPKALPLGVAVRPDGKPFSPMHQGPAKACGAPVVVEEKLDKEYAVLKNRMRSTADRLKSGGNGKHVDSEPQG